MKNWQKFENKIFSALLKINYLKLGYFIKSPTPLKFVRNNEQLIPIYFEKALCDFIGIFEKKIILIEAKNLTNKRFEFRRVKEHQIEQLLAIKQNGGYSFIFFNIELLDKMCFLEIESFINYKNAIQKKSIDINELINISEPLNLNAYENLFNLPIN